MLTLISRIFRHCLFRLHVRMMTMIDADGIDWLILHLERPLAYLLLLIGHLRCLLKACEGARETSFRLIRCDHSLIRYLERRWWSERQRVCVAWCDFTEHWLLLVQKWGLMLMVRCSTAEDRVEGTWVDWPLGQVLCQASRCRLPGRGLIKSAILLEHRVHGSIVA